MGIKTQKQALVFNFSLVLPWGCSYFSSAVPSLFLGNKGFGFDSSKLL